LAATRENSSRAPSAFWKLPGPGRPPAPRPRRGPILTAFPPRIVRPPPPTPALYADHAACDAADGSETSVLLEPRSTAYDFTVLLESNSINQFFHVGHAMALAPARLEGNGESFGFASRGPDRLGLVWLANPSGSLRGDEAFSTRLVRGEYPPRDRAAQLISLHSRPLWARWRVREIWVEKRCPQRISRTTQRANQPREWARWLPRPSARGSARSAKSN
jgi:hypothetical protein